MVFQLFTLIKRIKLLYPFVVSLLDSFDNISCSELFNLILELEIIFVHLFVLYFRYILDIRMLHVSETYFFLFILI